jgi:chloramphenicol-sensitive protein RarD
VAASSDLDRRGVGFGAASYALWGLFPAYWPLLAPAAPVEVLGHRILWTLVFMAGVLTVLSGWSALRSLSLRGWAMVAAASALIAVNWGLFIYAVSVDHVVEVALGYYIGPWSAWSSAWWSCASGSAVCSGSPWESRRSQWS